MQPQEPFDAHKFRIDLAAQILGVAADDLSSALNLSWQSQGIHADPSNLGLSERSAAPSETHPPPEPDTSFPEHPGDCAPECTQPADNWPLFAVSDRFDSSIAQTRASPNAGVHRVTAYHDIASSAQHQSASISLSMEDFTEMWNNSLTEDAQNVPVCSRWPNEELSDTTWVSAFLENRYDSLPEPLNPHLGVGQPAIAPPHESSFQDSSAENLSTGSEDQSWAILTPTWSGNSTETSSSDESNDGTALNSDPGESATAPGNDAPAPNPDLGESVMVSSIDSSSRPQATRIPIILKQIAPKSSITTAAQVGIENITLALTRGGAKGKGRRKPYSDSRVQKETNFTRLIKACVRCRMQRIRCNPDPNNPTGPCLSCQNVINTMSRLPCLRYKVTESVLHRTGLDYMAFYKAHPMVGPKFGDFYMAKDWTNAPTRFLDITQDRGTILQLEVREFRPPVEPGALDLKGRSMYAIPWAIADADVAVESINEFLDASVGPYLDHLLDDSNHLVWDVFHSALRLSLFPFPNELLRDVLRLWVGCRFIESRWRCCGTDNLDAEQLKDPFYEWISPPPYIDYQFASLVMHRVLGPLRRSILKGLQDLILANKAGNWYPIFLTVFILLYNYELSMVFQLQFALRRQAAVKYLDMQLVRGIHSGAKTILAHFHYCCKGQRPFRANFSWDSPENQRLADLDAEQSAFMKRIAGHVQCLGPKLQAIKGTSRYEADYWFIGQLFEEEWVPRDTHEHAPPMDQPDV